MKKIISFLTRYILTSFLILSLGGCHDDDTWNPYNTGEDGLIHLSLAIPEAEKVITRGAPDDEADERKINDLTVLIYNAGGQLQQRAVYPGTQGDLTPDDANYNYKTSFTLALNAAAKTANEAGSMTMVIVANAKDLISDTNSATLGALYLLTDKVTDIAGRDNGFVMSGKAENVTLSKNTPNTFVMTRTAAKFSGVVDDTAIEDFSLTAFDVRNTSMEGYLTAAVKDGSESARNYVATVGNNSGLVEVAYTYPTEADKAYVIVQGAYKGNDNNFYKVALIDENGNAVEIKPNHWYEMHIKEVSGPGYPSEELAIASQAANMVAAIHDHVPTVLSIQSDGTRELGVSSEVSYSGGEQPSGSWSDKTFTVKAFSLIAAEMTDEALEADPVEIKVTKGEGWLEFSEDGTPASGNADDSLTPGMTGSNDSPGVATKYKLGFRSTPSSGRLEGEITVSWKGLSRVVKVYWNREFKPENICSATLIIHDEDNSTTYTINNYWDFLAGKGTGTDRSGAPYLWGADETANLGKIRNQGFHFPVMYGDNTEKKWWYEYKLTPNSTFADQSISFEINGLSDYECKKENGEWMFRPVSKNGTTGNYSYQTGASLIMKVGDDNIPYPMNIYHTGFFHYDEYKHRTGEGSSDPSNGYYYYEVISTDNQYWLDRNLGAKAAGLWILNESNQPIVSTNTKPFVNGAQGAYYHVAPYKTDHDNEVYEYASDNMYGDLCPPGYRIPSVNEWDNVRNSSRFRNIRSSEGAVTYYNSYYAAESGNIYFPKVRFLQGGSPSGVSNGGYYWTKTDSKGLEKAEIGRWLQVLLLNGASNNYMNGNVESYGMSVRCVADLTESTSVNVTSFNVTGATHVFLYRKSGGKKIGIYSWPGKAIGDYNTMLYNTFNFVYTSMYSPGELYVIFNYVDGDNKVYTMSNNDFANTKEAHSEITLEEAEGWLVAGTPTGSVKFDPHRVVIDDAVSKVGTTWTCTPDVDVEKEYRIIWPKTEEGYNKIKISLGSDVLTDFAASTGSLNYDSKDYYSYSISTKQKGDLKFQFKTDGTDPVITPKNDASFNIPDNVQTIDGKPTIHIAELSGGTLWVPRFKVDIQWYWAKNTDENNVRESEPSKGNMVQIKCKDEAGNWIDVFDSPQKRTTDYWDGDFKYARYQGLVKETYKNKTVKIYISGNGKTWVSKNTYTLTESTIRLLDSDLQEENSGGGETETYYYKLHGQITGNSDWETTDLEKDGNNWKVTSYFSTGSFGIKKVDKDNEQTAWYAAKGDNTFYSPEGTLECNNGSNNFYLNDAGNYTLTFNPNTPSVALTKVVGLPAMSYSYKIRIYWNQDDERDGLMYGLNGSWTNTYQTGSETAPDTNNDSRYVDIAIPANTALTSLQLKVYNRNDDGSVSNNDEYPNGFNNNIEVKNNLKIKNNNNYKYYYVIY